MADWTEECCSQYHLWHTRIGQFFAQVELLNSRYLWTVWRIETFKGHEVHNIVQSGTERTLEAAQQKIVDYCEGRLTA